MFLVVDLINGCCWVIWVKWFYWLLMLCLILLLMVIFVIGMVVVVFLVFLFGWDVVFDWVDWIFVEFVVFVEVEDMLVNIFFVIIRFLDVFGDLFWDFNCVVCGGGGIVSLF